MQFLNRNRRQWLVLLLIGLTCSCNGISNVNENKCFKQEKKEGLRYIDSFKKTNNKFLTNLNTSDHVKVPSKNLYPSPDTPCSVKDCPNVEPIGIGKLEGVKQIDLLDVKPLSRHELKFSKKRVLGSKIASLKQFYESKSSSHSHFMKPKKNEHYSELDEMGHTTSRLLQKLLFQNIKSTKKMTQAIFENMNSDICCSLLFLNALETKVIQRDIDKNEKIRLLNKINSMKIEASQEDINRRNDIKKKYQKLSMEQFWSNMEGKD